MLVKYKSVVGATFAQMASDIALLCTGADISTLSASCDKANTAVLVSSQAPGWSILDATGPTNSVVITAPDFENLRTKIAGIGVSGTTGIYLTGYDTYNPATHVGTNGLVLVKSNGAYMGNTLALSTTVVNSLYIFVTPRFIVIADTSTSTNIVYHMEYSRDALYLQSPNYPNYCFGDDYIGQTTQPYQVSVSRIKNLAAGGDKTALCNINPGQIYLRGNNNIFALGNSNNSMRDASENIYYQLIPINVVQYNNTAAYYSNIGTIRDILLGPQNIGNFADTLTVNSQDYFVLPIFASGGRIAIPLV